MAAVAPDRNTTHAPGYGKAGSTLCGAHGWIVVGGEPSCSDCRALLEGLEPSSHE